MKYLMIAAVLLLFGLSSGCASVHKVTQDYSDEMGLEDTCAHVARGKPCLSGLDIDSMIMGLGH